MILTKEERKNVLDKLDKLLAHIGDGAVNYNEIAIANQKIKELTEKYGITLDGIEKIEKKGVLIENIKIDTLELNPKKWKRTLASSIARFYECRCVRSENIIHFIGFQLDAQVASEVYQKVYGLISRASRVMGAGNMIDFSYGAVVAIGKRLRDIENERIKVNEVTALMIVKKDSVDNEVNKIFSNLRKSKMGNFSHSNSFYKGIEYGKTIQIFDELKE